MAKTHLAATWRHHLPMAFAIVMAGGILLVVAASLDGGTGGENAGTTTWEWNPDIPVRILPLGDSITQSDKTYSSYRYYLWIKLIDAGIKFDYVGSLLYISSVVAVMWGFSVLPDILGFGLLAGGMIGGIVFIKWELKVESPILAIRIFRKNYAFTFSNTATFIPAPPEPPLTLSIPHGVWSEG